MAIKFVDTPYFQALAHSAFAKADEDGDGQIDLGELTLALCRLHCAVNKGAPGLSSLPTKAAVRTILAENDLNRDGVLSLQEFVRFAQIWFKTHGRKFAQRAILLALIYSVFIPQSAELIRDKVPGGRTIPTKLISLAITVGMFLAMLHVFLWSFIYRIADLFGFLLFSLAGEQVSNSL